MYREPGSILYLLAALPALHVAVTQGSYYLPIYLSNTRLIWREEFPDPPFLDSPSSSTYYDSRIVITIDHLPTNCNSNHSQIIRPA